MRHPWRTTWAVAAAIAAGLASACVDGGEVANPAAADAYFDLAAFVDYQDSALAGVGMRKRVRVGDVDETKDLADVDWATELASFTGANLNKPGLIGEYRRESYSGPVPGVHTIVYTPNDSTGQRVRELRIECLGEHRGQRYDCPYADVREVVVRTGFESLIADTEQRLAWTPLGYAIRSRQDVVGSEERVLVLEGEVAR